MKKLSSASLILLGLFCSLWSGVHAQVAEMEFPDGALQHVVRAAEIQWKPCPPNLPQGCEIAVLEGSPKAEGLFTVRFRVNEDMIMPAHTHPRNERVTILEGKAQVAFGKGAVKEDARTFVPGDYYVNALGAIHTVWLEQGTILQITGIGPWIVDYVE